MEKIINHFSRNLIKHSSKKVITIVSVRNRIIYDDYKIFSTTSKIKLPNRFVLISIVLYFFELL